MSFSREPHDDLMRQFHDGLADTPEKMLELRAKLRESADLGSMSGDTLMMELAGVAYETALFLGQKAMEMRGKGE